MSAEAEVPTTRSLKQRGLRQLFIGLSIYPVLVLVPAWSWRYWQLWLYLGLMAGFWTYFFLNLLKTDPQLVERRMQKRESALSQRVSQLLLKVLIVPAYVLAGLDFRFGWSRSWRGGVPLWLVLLGQATAVASYWWVFWVMKTNSFAASTIQVEHEQRVIRHGPYAFVRHPMYLGMSLMQLGVPLALGSYVALPAFALIIPVLVFRLIHEEKFLCQSLSGYADYCGQTRFRLVPLVW